MKIVVENRIPYIKEAIQLISSDILYLDYLDFNSENIKDADVLVVRTRVKCNRELLEGAQVKLIVTATIGFDHIDTAYCESNGICWTNTPGCNSNSVKQYIESVFYLIKRWYNLDLSKLTLGVIGVGHVGSRVVELGKRVGMKVLLNDPLRTSNESDFLGSSLKYICEESDIITFHTPLTMDGEYSTYHLANSSFFKDLKKKPILINTSRGEVIDTLALKDALGSGSIRQAIIDVWENEPFIDMDLLRDLFITTPHIAGYSADGKALASQMALEAIAKFYGLDIAINIKPPVDQLHPNMEIECTDYESAILEIYNPIRDSIALKKSPDLFEKIRGNYPIRRESESYRIITE